MSATNMSAKILEGTYENLKEKSWEIKKVKMHQMHPITLDNEINGEPENFLQSYSQILKFSNSKENFLCKLKYFCHFYFLKGFTVLNGNIMSCLVKNVFVHGLGLLRIC